MQKQKLPRRHRRTNEVPGAYEEAQKSRTLTIPWNLANLAKNYPGIIVRQHHTDRKQMGCGKSSAQSERGDICGIVAVRSGQRMVGGFHGMLLLSAKHSRSLVGWEDTI